MFYYQQPEPGRLPELLAAIDNWPGAADPSSVDPIAQFIAEAARCPGDPMTESIFEVADQGGLRTRSVALKALWYQDTELSRQLIETAANKWESQSAADLAASLLEQRPLPLHQAAPSAAVLYRWWGAFFATGDPGIVKLIAQQAHLLDTGSGMEVAIGGAAAWSLASNARRHGRVRFLLRDLWREAEGQRKRRYEEILTKADQGPTEPRSEK